MPWKPEVWKNAKSEQHPPFISQDGQPLPPELISYNRARQCWRCNRCNHDCDGGVVDPHWGAGSKKCRTQWQRWLLANNKCEDLLTFNPRHPDFNYYPETRKEYDKHVARYNEWQQEQENMQALADVDDDAEGDQRVVQGPVTMTDLQHAMDDLHVKVDEILWFLRNGALAGAPPNLTRPWLGQPPPEPAQGAAAADGAAASGSPGGVQFH